MQLLGHAGLRRILANHRAGGSGFTLELGEEEENETGGSRRSRRSKSWKNRFPPVPSEEGRKLMDGGVFGASAYFKDERIQRKQRLARKLMSRELGSGRRESTKTTSAISQVILLERRERLLLTSTGNATFFKR